MEMTQTTQIKVGDRIRFRSPTRNQDRTVWRTVNGFWPNTDKPTVRFNGWPDFVVYRDEITEIEPKNL